MQQHRSSHQGNAPFSCSHRSEIQKIVAMPAVPQSMDPRHLPYTLQCTAVNTDQQNAAACFSTTSCTYSSIHNEVLALDVCLAPASRSQYHALSRCAAVQPYGLAYMHQCANPTMLWILLTLPPPFTTSTSRIYLRLARPSVNPLTCAAPLSAVSAPWASHAQQAPVQWHLRDSSLELQDARSASPALRQGPAQVACCGRR